MQRLWCLRGESPGCSLVRARRRTCRLSRNEINVQGAGLELRHVKLSHRCFSSILASAIPAGNERKRRIAPYRDGQRKIGWTASRATERPFRPCLRAPGRGSVIRMYHVSQAKVRCRSSSTSRDRNSFRPFSPHPASLPQSLSRETSSPMFPTSSSVRLPDSCGLVASRSTIMHKTDVRTYTSVLTPRKHFADAYVYALYVLRGVTRYQVAKFRVVKFRFKWHKS